MGVPEAWSSSSTVGCMKLKGKLIAFLFADSFFKHQFLLSSIHVCTFFISSKSSSFEVSLDWFYFINPAAPSNGSLLLPAVVFPLAAMMNLPSVVPIMGERPVSVDAAVLYILKLCWDMFTSWSDDGMLLSHCCWCWGLFLKLWGRAPFAWLLV